MLTERPHCCAVPKVLLSNYICTRLASPAFSFSLNKPHTQLSTKVAMSLCMSLVAQTADDVNLKGGFLNNRACALNYPVH